MTWDKDITDNAFPQGTFSIQVGDTVRWTHRGSAPHSVTAEDGSFDSSPQCPGVIALCMTGGATFSHKFTSVDQIDYFCKVHSSMRGTITVLERYDPTP